MRAQTIDLAGLYVSEQGRLRRFVNRIVGDWTVAEDLVQDAFANLMGPAAKGVVRDEKAYLARIARNLAIDHHRKESALVALDEEALFSLADPAPSAETVMADRQALQLTLKIIAALPDRTRKALEMHRLGESTLSEIAQALGMSTAHAGRLVMDGYRIVRDRLREAGVE